MGNSTKKITTNIVHVKIAKNEIKLGTIDNPQLVIESNKISNYLIDFTNDHLKFTINFLNLEICRWIHEILQTRRMNVELYFCCLSCKEEIIQYLLDNTSIYNTKKLYVQNYQMRTKELFNLYDQIFKAAIASCDLEEITFVWHKFIIYDKNTIKLDD